MAHTPEVKAAWTLLVAVANTDPGDPARITRLWEKAVALGEAIQKSKPAPTARAGVKPAARASTSQPVTNSRGQVIRSGHVCPFGRNKGVPIEELNDRDLAFLLNKAEEDQENPEKAKWKEKNRPYLEALRKERDSR